MKGTGRERGRKGGREEERSLISDNRNIQNILLSKKSKVLKNARKDEGRERRMDIGICFYLQEDWKDEQETNYRWLPVGGHEEQPWMGIRDSASLLSAWCFM